MALSRADLEAAHFCARVADAVTTHDHPIRRWLPTYMQKLAAELAMSELGHQSDTDPAELEHDELITAAQAAAILRRSKRQVQRIATSLDDQIICGRWLFNLQTVLEYAEAMQNE